ncbi:MAG: RDD family protein, partial [Gammaproteobacteria bacterium]|nr:RDD family protein [Gammaproteobacteria bacterium]
MGAPEDVAREFLAQLDLRPATLLRRGAAFLIDVALGLVLLAPVLLLASVAFEGGLDWGTGPPWFTILIVAGVALALSIPVLSVVYFPLLEGLWGQTIGKRAVGICVVKETGERADWAAVIIRRFPFYFDFFWLDALFAPFTKRRQRAFDLVAR